VALSLPEPPAPAPREAAAHRGGAARALLVFFAGYLVVQIALPLRHFFYAGDVNWNEEGHRFSWRMKLRDKDVAELFIYTEDPATGARALIDLEAWLTDLQLDKMATRPDMIRDFARIVADDAQKRTGVRPLIMAEVSVSLNGGPYRYLLDPKQDLAAR
jgi:hypothetical protein